MSPALRDRLTLALLLVPLLAAFVGMHTPRRGAPTRSDPLLLPGVEPRMMRALAPLYADGLTGYTAGDVRLERDVVRIALTPRNAPACERHERLELTRTDARAARTPVDGAIELTQGALLLRACLCTPADPTELAALATRLEPTAALWETPLETHTDAAPRVRDFGLVGPAAAALGVSPALIVDLSFFLALLVLFFAIRALPASSPEPTVRFAWRTAALPLALAALGLAARVGYALAVPEDRDEGWARQSPTELFADSHDAWVHPPLGRALCLFVADLAQFDAHTPFGTLRVSSLVLAFCVFTILALSSSRQPRGSVAIACIALLGAPIEAGALARPYALVALAWAALLSATTTPRPSGTRLAIGVIAALACAYTDLLAGVFAIAWLLVFTARSAPRRVTALTAASLAVGTLALIPGALEAGSHHRGGDTGADLRAHDTLAFARDLFAGLAPPFSAAWIGAAVVLGSAVLAWRRGARVESAFLLVAVLACLALLSVVALRPRNVAFLAFVLAATCLADRRTP